MLTHCEVLPQLDDSVGKCFHNEGIIVQWQSELHGEPSILAVSVEQNSGQRYELSQQQLKYTVNFCGENGLYSTYIAFYSGIMAAL